MADPEHLEILRQGVGAWNEWRTRHPEVIPDLVGANLWQANLGGANLGKAKLSGANLSRANLDVAQVSQSVLLHMPQPLRDRMSQNQPFQISQVNITVDWVSNSN